MQLQQLRYVIAIAENGSMNAVARSLFVSQSSLSVAVRDLEEELGIKIFNRTSRGISLTSDGVEFMSYARQVIEQVDLLTQHYSGKDSIDHRRLSISSQHYAFVVNAFVDFVTAHDDPRCKYVLRETRTSNIIEDVTSFRSDIGILYLSNHNEHVLRTRFEESSLIFTSLFKAVPHVFVRKNHPLAKKEILEIDDLAPYPRYTFEQGADSSLYYSEEPLATLPHDRNVVVSDRATMTALLSHCDGFLVSTGVRSDEMYSGIISLPVRCDETMNVGYVVHSQRRLSTLARGYISTLYQLILHFAHEGNIVPSRATQKVAEALLARNNSI